MPEPPAQTLMTELCFADAPVLDARRILAAVRRVRPDAELVSDSGADTGALVIGYRELRNRYADARAAMLLNAISAPVADGPGHVRDLRHTQGWAAAPQALGSSRYAVLVADLLGRDVPPGVRVQAYQAALAAVVAQSGPVATWWPASQQALPPEQAAADPLRGLVNVRLHGAPAPGSPPTDTGEDEVAVLDTLGLYALGLPDLQCRFRYLDRGLLADLFRTAARYLVRGGRFGPDQPVRGFTPDQRWPVRQSRPFVGPERPVLTVDPGQPFTA